MESKGAVIDELKLFRVDDSRYRTYDPDHWKLEMKTEYSLSPLQKVMKALGLYKCIDDALTNYAVSDFATYISTKYGYASVGIDGTDGTNYTLTDLKSPVFTRVACTKAYETTYSPSDTAVFTGITTATSTETLTEFGLHDASTSGNMGARQTSCTWDVVDGETFGMIWRVVCSRG